MRYDVTWTTPNMSPCSCIGLSAVLFAIDVLGCVVMTSFCQPCLYTICYSSLCWIIKVIGLHNLSYTPIMTAEPYSLPTIG